MQRHRAFVQRIVLAPAGLVLGLIVATPTLAQNGWDLRTHEIYVKMDFWKPAAEQSAEAWHFDPHNGNQWTQLPNDPATPTPPLRASFEVSAMFPPGTMDPWVYFLGVPKIRIVTGQPDQLVDVSAMTEYRHMIDRMAMKVGPSERVTGGAVDPCGDRIWPIATGNALTPYSLYPHAMQLFGGYGMHMQRNTLLSSAVWRWNNPANVPQADVYIEFTLSFDLHDDNQVVPQWRHDKVSVSWISADAGCAYDFCLGPGQTQKAGRWFTPGVLGTTVVVAVPYALDHATSIRLSGLPTPPGGQPVAIADQVPDNDSGEPSSHKCEPDGTAIPWHTHPPGVKGHLRWQGLSQWQGFVYLGPLGSMRAVADYDVPAHSMASPINDRGLWIVFWNFYQYPGGP